MKFTKKIIMKKICIIWAWSWIGKVLAEYYKNSQIEVDSFTRNDGDLSELSDIKKLSKRIWAANYDFVIFSAGIGYHALFEKLSSEQISEQVMVNTLAPLHILKWFKDTTKFVYLSSIIQYIPAKNMPVYAAMKHATSQTLSAIGNKNILSVDLWAVKTDMHIKAGMKRKVGRDIEKIIPKLVKTIEKKHGSKTLFWDWWCLIYIVFPLYRIFLKFI